MTVHSQRYYGPPRRGLHPVKSDNFQRASDAERRAVVEQLRLNCGEGRITMDEFSERAERALAATTGGELRGLLADLPIAAVPPSPEQVAHRKRTARLAIVVPYLVVNVFLVLIWFFAELGHWSARNFWPIWAILGWGLGVAFALLGISRSDGQRYPGTGSGPGSQAGQLGR